MIKMPIVLLTAAVIGTTGGSILPQGNLPCQDSILAQNTVLQSCLTEILPGIIIGGNIGVILTGLPGLLPDLGCPDSDAPDSEVPDSDLPDIEFPDTELPDTEVPDFELPDQDLPNTELPDEDLPDSDLPEFEFPDFELPEPEVPDTNLPDLELPETNLPDAELPGTGTPDADSPDSEAPDSSVEDVLDTSFAAQVVRLVNEERRKAGLSELAVDVNVQSAANVRAKEIVSSFSHTRPDGRSFSTALREAGVSFRGSGENIAWGQRTPEAVVQAWMNSAGHRANILNASYTTIGVGYYVVNNTPYWVQLFTY